MKKLCIAIVGLWSIPAWAYLDPATGGMIIQGLVAIVAGIAVAGKLYWTRVSIFVKRITGKQK